MVKHNALATVPYGTFKNVNEGLGVFSEEYDSVDGYADAITEPNPEIENVFSVRFDDGACMGFDVYNFSMGSFGMYSLTGKDGSYRYFSSPKIQMEPYLFIQGPSDNFYSLNVVEGERLRENEVKIPAGYSGEHKNYLSMLLTHDRPDLPVTTPWGRPECYRELAYGVFDISSSSGGGVMIKKDRGDLLLSENAREDIAFYDEDHGYYCFNEDAEIFVAYRELLDYDLIDPSSYNGVTAAEWEREVDTGLLKNFPNYRREWCEGVLDGHETDPLHLFYEKCKREVDSYEQRIGEVEPIGDAEEKVLEDCRKILDNLKNLPVDKVPSMLETGVDMAQLQSEYSAVRNVPSVKDPMSHTLNFVADTAKRLTDEADSERNGRGGIAGYVEEFGTSPGGRGDRGQSR